MLGVAGSQLGTGPLWPSNQGRDAQQGKAGSREGESTEDKDSGKASLPGPLHTSRKT